MKTKMLALLSFGAVMMLGAGSVPARAMPMTPLTAAASGDVVQVYHHGRPHRIYRRYPERVVVYPQRYGYPDYYATSRGFMDPGFAVRGNLSGCATDLGYGRWESCDK
jgi:hypothetical protein